MVVSCWPSTTIYRFLGLFWQLDKEPVTQKRLYKCYTVDTQRNAWLSFFPGNMIFVYV